MVGDSGNAMLCDFGVTKALSNNPTGLTTGNLAKGTLRYASPELYVKNRKYVPLACDTWAWGCLFLNVGPQISIPKGLDPKSHRSLPTK